MVGMPQPFTTASPYIKSYSWVDIADGTGYINFYPFMSSDDYLMTTNSSVCSDSIFTYYSTGSTTYVTAQDLDFDVTFNLAQRVKGNLIFNITHGVNLASGNDGKTAYSRITVTVYHYDGSTETQLGTKTGNAFEKTIGTVDSTEYWQTDCLVIALTEKQFEAGDTLRISVLQEAKASSGGTCKAFLALDPAGRTSEINSTYSGTIAIETDNPATCLAQVPFKIDS